MKNIHKLSLQVLRTLVIIGFSFSCVPDDDEAPIIEADSFQLLAYNSVTEEFDIEINEDIPLVIPGSFVIKGTFSDNVQLNGMLATVEPVNIENNTSDILYSIYPWEEDQFEIALKGTSTEVFREIDLPTSAQSGLYNFSLVLYDELNNISEELNSSFRIENNSPLIALNEPNEDFIEMTTGEILTVLGEVTSDHVLDTVIVRVGVGDYFATEIYAFDVDNTGEGLEETQQFEINTSFELDTLIGVGRRYLRIYAKDIESNEGELEVTLQIE
ncbi:hypothetical protein [Chondrinema litorale]|uniref:hypothetical protein n=1 Tax=Chondrinema litorale TaxID=2994555 RepID=UPI002543CB36|nr:hypothetical protein [Chondrinema litorale]UZR92903.1 hypothetical protein OQ292_13660 [Chondrinema litorale]